MPWIRLIFRCELFLHEHNKQLDIWIAWPYFLPKKWKGSTRLLEQIGHNSNSIMWAEMNTLPNWDHAMQRNREYYCAIECEYIIALVSLWLLELWWSGIIMVFRMKWINARLVFTCIQQYRYRVVLSSRSVNQK